jgi:hypothetical protein
MTKRSFVLALSIAMLYVGISGLALAQAQEQAIPDKTMQEVAKDLKEVQQAMDEAAKPKPRSQRVKLFSTVIEMDDYSDESINALEGKVNAWLKANSGVTVVSRELKVSSAGGVAAATSERYNSVRAEEFQTTIVIAIFYEQ